MFDQIMQKGWLSQSYPQVIDYPHSYGHLSVISTYNHIYRMYNPIEITTYNW